MYLNPAPLALTTGDLIAGRLDLRDHINAFCDRLEKYDRDIKAFLPEQGRRERLLKEADRLVQAYPKQSARPPLFGVLVGVKDIFHVEGFSTAAGSNLDPALLAGPEAECIGLLRRAGALILGKTATTEFAYFEPGPTRNPHNLDHTPGGSSSGSAAGIAAGLCQLSLGTQTIGSVIRPAAFCGIAGFKPSYGRIPTAGLIYFSRSVDHVGYFTQDFAGMEIVAEVLCSGWQEIKVNYKPVLGVPRGKYLEQADPEALKAFNDQLRLLCDSGYQVKEFPALDDIGVIASWHRKLIAAEMAAEHEQWFAQYSHLYRPRTRELIMEGQALSRVELLESRRRQAMLKDKLETLRRENRFDLWVSPSAPGPAPAGIEATGNPIMNLPWTSAGLPSVNVPAGRSSNKLPLGLQLVAPFMGDELLLKWAWEAADIFSSLQADMAPGWN